MFTTLKSKIAPFIVFIMAFAGAEPGFDNITVHMIHL